MKLTSKLFQALFAIALINSIALAQYDQHSFSAMKWRLVGPHRGGRDATPSCLALKNDLARWRQINQEKLPALNRLSQKQKIARLPIAVVAGHPTCPK